MVWYNTDEFEKFFQDPPSTRGFKLNGKPRNHAKGVYHGLEFHDNGTNAIRIYLAAQFLESDWVQTLHDNSEYGHHSFARDGDVFATLARQLSELEPCLQNVTGEALFWMYDKMMVKYGQVHSMMASRGGGDRLEASERRRAERIARIYPMPRMDSIQGLHQVPAFGGHWPPREDRRPAVTAAAAAPAMRQRQGQGQGQARAGGAAAAARQQHAAMVAPILTAAERAARSAAHAAAAVTASGPAPAATTARAVGPVRNVGAGTRIAPIFIDDFDDGEGQIVAAPVTANSRAAARANAARPY
ncbi:hypothetical protein BGZ97_011243 [Linnemannia gamsii]|uniref:Uncharacterized protein n=1 Tax=Linnemannia gamsii TaxID=64522 RepID=A0A9P6R8A3_9FUNG|nr:hypothetical protein BGZ97_011243 [Linnemannia gamsii]